MKEPQEGKPHPSIRGTQDTTSLHLSDFPSSCGIHFLPCYWDPICFSTTKCFFLDNLWNHEAARQKSEELWELSKRIKEKAFSPTVGNFLCRCSLFRRKLHHSHAPCSGWKEGKQSSSLWVCSYSNRSPGQARVHQEEGGWRSEAGPKGHSPLTLTCQRLTTLPVCFISLVLSFISFPSSVLLWGYLKY